MAMKYEDEDGVENGVEVDKYETSGVDWWKKKVN